MAIDYVLLRPRRKDKHCSDFFVVLRKEIRATQYRKLGLYDPKNGRVEEWCHKEDFEYFSEQRKSDLDQG